MDSIYVSIGQHMKEYRKSRNMTQEQVAEKITVSSNYYGKVERGAYHLSYNMLSYIYKEFGWDIDYILTGVKKSYNPFSALIEKCPDDKKSDYINLIVWAMEQKLDEIMELEESVVRDFKEKLNVTRLCSASYIDIIAEDSVLYNIRQNHGLTSTEMAKELDMNQRSYNWLEKGKCKPAVDTFVLIDKKLGINPSFLMTGKFENMTVINEIWDKLGDANQKAILTFLEQGLVFLL